MLATFRTGARPCNQATARSVEVAEFSSRGYVGIVRYSASVAAYKGVLMHTGNSQRCNCALAS